MRSVRRGPAGLRPLRYAGDVLAVAALLASQAWAQHEMSTLDRGYAQSMLRTVADDVRKHYYDPRFHGIDWDATVAGARAQIEKASSMNDALAGIADALDALNDSHTFFVPPPHADRYDYGWTYQMIGERCFVMGVRPGSDAAAKGVKSGDEILSINGYTPTRTNIAKMQYVFFLLRPQLRLRLKLREPTGNQRQVDVETKVIRGKRIMDLSGGGQGGDLFDLMRQQENERQIKRLRSADIGKQLMILKVPEFVFSTIKMDDLLGKARSRQSLIIDLRGDSGGAMEALHYLLGAMFDKDVKVADRVGRKEGKPEIAKAGRHRFSGRLVVLVDARSSSAAELFARVVQIEKRGTVIGDRTSGRVMEAWHYREALGQDANLYFGVSVTESDLIMSDGKSLEHTGMVPDETILPSAEDLASGRDPVLSRAAELLGAKVSPEDAGKLFPIEWPAD
jgi:carboxyl-terminal processing protease